MLPVTEIDHSPNVFIHGSTINSAQRDFHIHNKDSESGKHNFRSVRKSILIYHTMKDFVTWNEEFLLERFMIRPNATRHQSVTLIPARPFDRLFWTGSLPKVQLLSSGFTDLLVPVRRRSFRQLQSLYAVHPDRVRILGVAFSFLEERKGAIKAILYFQQSHINLLWKYLDYVNLSIV